jgi:hypothetical protein
MDITAFNELIAQVRATAAALAEAEQRVAAFKAELAEQGQGAQVVSPVARTIKPLPKRVNSGWLPADKPIPTRAASPASISNLRSTGTPSHSSMRPS